MSVQGDLAAGMERRGLENYVEYAIHGPDVIPEAFFVAVKGDEYVGLSHVKSMEKGVSLYQCLTGVQPACRRLGLGLAMKVRCIAYAQANGYTLIAAENDARNLPMLAMNARLGYVRQPELITYEKQVRPGEK
jgi:mycothiol synthase